MNDCVCPVSGTEIELQSIDMVSISSVFDFVLSVLSAWFRIWSVSPPPHPAKARKTTETSIICFIVLAILNIPLILYSNSMVYLLIRTNSYKRINPSSYFWLGERGWNDEIPNYFNSSLIPPAFLFTGARGQIMASPRHLLSLSVCRALGGY